MHWFCQISVVCVFNKTLSRYHFQTCILLSGVEIEPEYPSTKYKFFSSPAKTLEEAMNSCFDHGMRLAEIDSWKENAFVHAWLDYLMENGTLTGANKFIIGKNESTIAFELLRDTI